MDDGIRGVEMFGLGISETLFYMGLVLMTLAAVGTVVAIIVFFLSGRRLKAALEDAYGRKES